MEGNKQRNGFLRKVQTMISSLSNEISMLTTDAVPDKSYVERKSETPLNRNEIVTDVKRVKNSSVVQNSSQNFSDEDEVKNEDTSKKKPFFSTKSSKSKKKEEKKHSGDKDRVVYNISNCSDVHVGHKINLMRNVQINSQNSRKPKMQVPVTPEINDVLSDTSVSRTELTVEHIREIHADIGDNWRDVGRSLGFSDARLDQITTDFSPQKERVYRMLLEWIQQSKPTVGLLCRCLWAKDEKTAVKILASHMSQPSKTVD